MRRLALAFLFLLAALTPALAEDARALKGVALVIGQSKYQHINALPNPANDARDIESLLEDLGFDVTGVADRDAKKLRRDLERFSEDADGADVAIVYYSGHGIEAGGENWLVPVDADPASMPDIGESLVPLTFILDELKSKVAVTIFLVDACRSNPFPPGTLAKKEGVTVAMGEGGLATPRGFTPIESETNESLGTVIGFAAEPGQPALDGEVGGNSPYAAAILRHLAALQGEEFGLVMRMVTEEVYLKTKTKQRPWINESLRKQLFFGAPQIETKGDDALITGERRKLLLTIADLPAPQRKQVESIAQADGVPLDTLYGVLRALGETEISQDPGALDRALKAQAEKLKSIMAESRALATDDPEIMRLASAADTALAEGAIKTARQFLDRAKDAVEGSRGTIENVEAKAKAKRAANAEILVKSGETAELDFDFLAAAGDYAKAFDWVRESDRVLAAKYKTFESDAIQTHGNWKGDPASLRRAVKGYRQALSLNDRSGDLKQWIKTSNNLANTFLIIGTREVGTVELHMAAAIFRDVLAANPQSGDLKGWAITQSNLGVVLQALGERSGGGKLLKEAEAAYEAALAARSREEDPVAWATAKVNIGTVLRSLADTGDEETRLTRAIASLNQAMEVFGRDSHPLEWAQAMNNLGAAYRLLAVKQHKVEFIDRAEQAYRDSLTVFTRDKTPVDWATANGNLGIALANKGAMTGDFKLIEELVKYDRLALEELKRERAPAFWANIQTTLGIALQATGHMREDEAVLQESAAVFRQVLEVRTRAADPAGWAETQRLLGQSLSALSSMKLDDALAGQAIAAFRQALAVYDRRKFPQEWNSTMASLATTLQGTGIREKGEKSLLEASAIFQNILQSISREKSPAEWATAMKDVAVIQFMLGTKRGNKADVEQSIASFDSALAVYKSQGDVMSQMMLGAMRKNAVDALALFK